MNILEALKFAGKKELKHFVWGEEVIVLIESTGVSLEITTESTGDDVLHAIDALSHEMQIDILTRPLSSSTVTDPEPETACDNNKLNPKSKFLNCLIQTILSSGGLIMLLVFTIVAYDTFKVTPNGEDDAFLSGLVDLLLWVAKFLAHGLGG